MPVGRSNAHCFISARILLQRVTERQGGPRQIPIGELALVAVDEDGAVRTEFAPRLDQSREQRASCARRIIADCVVGQARLSLVAKPNAISRPHKLAMMRL